MTWEKSKVAAGEEENINCKNSNVYLPNIKLRIKDYDSKKKDGDRFYSDRMLLRL